MSPEIAHEISLKVSPRSVYEALTEPTLLQQWWIPDTRGESKVGESLEFWFSRDACQVMTVTALEPEQLVRWKTPAGDSSDWAGTEVEFALAAQRARTRLTFRHYGWHRPVERLPYYSMSWAVFLISLKDLLQKGKGYPFPNEWIHE